MRVRGENFVGLASRQANELRNRPEVLRGRPVIERIERIEARSARLSGPDDIPQVMNGLGGHRDDPLAA